MATVGGGVLMILILVVAVAMSSGDDAGKGKKKGKKAIAGDTGSGGSTSSAGNTSRDISSRDLPPSKDVPILREEIKKLKEEYPADLTALSDQELNALIDEWEAFVNKFRQSSFDGYSPKTKRKFKGEAEGPWQKAREEKYRRDELKRKGNT